MPVDPNKIAVEYYFGDLQYWKLPRIAADALEDGHDGPALRRLAGLADRIGSDVREEDIEHMRLIRRFVKWELKLQLQRTRRG